MARLRKHAAKLQKRIDRINELRRARSEEQRPSRDLMQTSTGYEPGALIFSRDGKTIYQVQADGSHRKLPREQRAGEFQEVERGG